MIRQSNKPLTSSGAVKYFSDWAWILTKERNELIVTIAVYVDDSGTDNPTGKKGGSREAVFTGLAAPVEDWRIFVRKWQATLNKYHVPFFHFWEWSDAFHEHKKHGMVKTGLFKGLTGNQLDSMVIELAKIARACT